MLKFLNLRLLPNLNNVCYPPPFNEYIYIRYTSSNDEFIYKKKQNKNIVREYVYWCCLVFNLLRHSPVYEFLLSRKEMKSDEL